MVAKLAIVGFPIVFQAQGLARDDGAVGREKPFAVVTHHERAVVDEKLGEKGEGDEADEKKERPVAAPDGTEAPELFFGDRIEAERHQTKKRGNAEILKSSGCFS